MSVRFGISRQRRPMMQLTPQNMNSAPPNVIVYRNPAQPVIDPAVPPSKPKMRWGAPTWFLFHTLAHKVKEDVFLQISAELLQNIATICHNLPCPVCAEHAKKYLSSKPFFQIRTKQQLKDFLFTFHNQVNKEKDIPQYSYDDLDTKYESAVTSNIVQNFMYYFQDRSHNVKLIADDLHRKRLVVVLKDWFNKNIQHFDP